ncbi:hypothetical protein AKO1_008933 [Acrasis kona]|uniref:KATNIP domain-containing protein n=1 Tax=Acrasis kona TaxID=1008807 RepID=A0AAW2ZFK7_9EUKA
MVRKAPGNSSFDFGHTINFTMNMNIPSPKSSVHNSYVFNSGIQEAIIRAKSSKLETPRAQDYETTLLPCGYVFKLHLNSSYGDQFYIGLNGIEIYDAVHNKIPLTINNVQAIPKSIQELPNNKNDVRTLDKLIDGENYTWNDRHMWLAPYIPGQTNYLYVIFEEPVAVSMIKIWNYSKTVSRGVEELEIYADDVLIYKGFLRKAHEQGSDVDFAQSILFTNDSSIVKKERDYIYSRVGSDQEVHFYNDSKVVSKKLPNPMRMMSVHSQNNLARPMTSVTHKS